MRAGQRRLYLVDPDGMASLQEFFAELWPAGPDRLKHVVETAPPDQRPDRPERTGRARRTGRSDG
jgi:hypothetical protein